MGDFFLGIWSGLIWLLSNLWAGVFGIFTAIGNPGEWLGWAWSDDKTSLMKLIFYGASTELFFAIFFIAVTAAIVGVFNRSFLWGVVRGIEAFQNSVGRFFAWAGLVMVLQQVMIIFLQRIFRESAISFGFADVIFERDVSWWSEELKLYNAMIVALCVGYTYVQGSHVRVDLFYAGVRFRTKKVVDMFGSLVFMLPLTVIIWLFSWYFMWRNMINPPVSVTDDLDRLLLKARAVRWNIETIGFSPNGFDAYILFKVLILGFAGTMFIMAWGAFYRALLEFIEGPESENKYLDKDTLGDDIAETAAQIH